MLEASQSDQAVLAPPLRPPSLLSGWRRGAVRFVRQKPLGAFGLLVILLLFACAAFAPAIAPYHYAERAGPTLESPGGAHLFGTDKLGRDLFSRMIYGARATVIIGLGAAGIGSLAALVVGLTSGFIGGWYDTLMQRLVDTLMSLPGIVVVLSVIAFVGGGTTITVFMLAFLAAPSMSRVIRGATLGVRQAPYIEAARAVSASTPRLILRHTLPNIVAPTLVVATLAVGNAILAEAALSFLGFGVNPPTPSWGQELNTPGRSFMRVAPWLAIFPGLAITLTVFSFNMLGDAIRDVTDPQLRNS